MNISRYSASIRLLLAFALFMGSIIPFQGQEGAKDQAKIGDNVVPVTDDDLKRLTEALTSASKSIDSCVFGSCFEVQCDDARALQDTLLATEKALTKIQSALAKASELQLKKLEEIQGEAAEKAEDTHARELALIWSKALNDAGKISLAVASLLDGFEELKKGFDALEDTTDFGEFFRQCLKACEQCLEQINEFVTLCDDLGSSFEHISNIEHENFRPEILVTFQRWKSNATDIYHVLFEFRKELTRLMTAPDRIAMGKKVAKLNLAELKSNARASLKNIGLIIGRELADIAENGTTIPMIGKRLAGQKDLQNDIEENKKIIEALEPHHASVYQEFLRIIYREEAIHKSLVLAQGVSQKSLACVNIFDCPNGGTPPSVDKPGMSFGDILKKYNAEILTLTERIKVTTSKLALKEGVKPKLIVNTKKVGSGTDVMAQYQVADCKETEGARIQVRDTRSLAITMDLGEAKRGSEESFRFKAPANVGNYELVILTPNSMEGRVLRVGGRLAVDSFSVVDFPQISLSGVWECKKLLTKPGSTYGALPLSMESPPAAGGFVPVQLHLKQVKDSFDGETGPDKFTLKIHGIVSGTSFAADAIYTFDNGEKVSGVWKLTILDADHFRVNPTFKDRPAASSINAECEFGRVR